MCCHAAIYNHVLEGNVLKAIELTNQLAVDLLANNKDVHFDLLTLHFVELVRAKDWYEWVTSLLLQWFPWAFQFFTLCFCSSFHFTVEGIHGVVHDYLRLDFDWFWSDRNERVFVVQCSSSRICSERIATFWQATRSIFGKASSKFVSMIRMILQMVILC